MESGLFMDRSAYPDDQMLKTALENTYQYWIELSEFTSSVYPSCKKEWNYPGAKYGWSFRIKDKKRAIIYLLPREKYFMVAFVFGQKATDIILQSDISADIRAELSAARVYAEGRGIRIPIYNSLILPDIMELIRIKIAS